MFQIFGKYLLKRNRRVKCSDPWARRLGGEVDVFRGEEQFPHLDVRPAVIGMNSKRDAMGPQFAIAWLRTFYPFSQSGTVPTGKIKVNASSNLNFY
jgi:hypothetical protein